MSVFVISHKPTQCPNLKNYKLIQVGAKNKEHYCNLSDDTGDNISEKNPFFCELTGLYWIWKNTQEEYIGIVHYRRFFTKNFSSKKFIQDSEVKKILTKYDVILPIHVHVKKTIRDQFLENTGTVDDLLALENSIIRLFPDYFDTYNKVFNDHIGYFRNMFIMNRDEYDKYCSWLFALLFDLESHLDVSDYSDYHKRIFGFIAERLLYVYVLHNNLKVCEIGYVQTDLKQNPIKDFAKRIQRVYVYHRESTIL